MEKSVGMGEEFFSFVLRGIIKFNTHNITLLTSKIKCVLCNLRKVKLRKVNVAYFI
jgi:hypothetical protein